MSGRNGTTDTPNSTDTRNSTDTTDTTEATDTKGTDVTDTTGIGSTGRTPEPAEHRNHGEAAPGDGAPGRSVIVVGAGPTGLLLAGDLAAAGVPVTLVEKRAPGISNLSRALVVHARTLEQFAARGIADELVAKGQPLDRLALFDRLTVRLDTLPSRFNFVLVVPQYEVEAVLQRRAVAAGVRFAHRMEAREITQDQDGAVLKVRRADGREEALHAAYVVGTDGLHSTVRRAVGLPFPGRSVIRSLILADVRLTRPPESVLTLHTKGDAFAVLAPFSDGYHRVICWQRGRDVPDTAPPDFDEIRGITRRAFGDDYGMHDPRWMSRFHSDERQAPAYRVGRVFLAGDAAHVHTPAGGQGMNTGLQDAANLSWKLAGVLTGGGPRSLLDTYQQERHAAGRAALRSSGALVRLATARWPWTRAVRTAFTTFVDAVPAAHAGLVSQISGIGLRYRAPRGAHRLTGRRMPDVRLAGGGRLYGTLRGARFVLIGPAGTGAGDLAGRVVPARWAGDRRTTVLVRPDGYVAWAAEAPDGAAVAAAVTRWTGSPASRTARG